MKNTCFSLLLFLLFGCVTSIKESKKEEVSDAPEYIVAAYVWPSNHNEKMVEEYLWSEGIGEWEMIKKTTPHFEGHYQPRVPLWGYQLDNDPKAWQVKIQAAVSHKVNTFIFDWYWYDGQPFLEETVDKGFLGAENNSDMNFYLMWANHDVPGNMWNQYKYDTDELLWTGEVDLENYRLIVQRLIHKFFVLNNYLKIEGDRIGPFLNSTLGALINNLSLYLKTGFNYENSTC
jgi:hypothetical protein